MNALALDFPETNYSDWEKQFLKEIAEVPLNSLLYGNDPSIKIHPFQFERLAINPSSKEIEKNAHFLGANYWFTSQKYNHSDSAQLNTELLHDLNAGLEAIHLIYNEKIDLNIALKNVDLDYVPLTIHVNDLNINLNFLIALCREIQSENMSLSIALAVDELCFSKNADIIEILKFGKKVQNAGFDFCLDFSWSGDNGFSHQTQFAVWLNLLSNMIQELNPEKLQFVIAVQPGLIEEIVKINTIKQLYYNLLGAEGKLNTNSVFRFKAISGNIYLSKYDQNNNMIRLTSIAMASAYAGCEEMALESFDKTGKHAPGFGYRISRNIQHLLKEESYFNQVKDALKGAYAIENLIVNNIQSAWTNWVNRNEDFKSSVNALKTQMKIDQENWINGIKNNEIQIIGINKFSAQKLSFKDYDTNKLPCRLHVDELFTPQIA